jgi:hypothetical protein
MEGIHQSLTPEQEIQFRQWARDNYTPGDKINSAWHPVVINECNIINKEAKPSADDVMAHRDRIKDAVTKYLDSNSFMTGIADLAFNPEKREHIIECGTSILCTKWKVGYKGGSFVQAVVDNNLMEAFGNADIINQQALRFYVTMLYNMRYVE